MYCGRQAVSSVPTLACVRLKIFKHLHCTLALARADQPSEILPFLSSAPWALKANPADDLILLVPQVFFCFCV